MGTLRSLLAVSVLITHADPIFGINLLNGDFAVTCFYVISGFLITLILSEKYVTETKAFFVNRGLRVYVPYIAALLFSIVVFASIEFPSHNPISSYDRVRLTGDDSWIWWSAFSNVTLLGMDLTRYIQVNPDLGISWPNFMHEGVGGVPEPAVRSAGVDTRDRVAVLPPGSLPDAATATRLAAAAHDRAVPADDVDAQPPARRGRPDRPVGDLRDPAEVLPARRPRVPRLPLSARLGDRRSARRSPPRRRYGRSRRS